MSNEEDVSQGGASGLNQLPNSSISAIGTHLSPISQPFNDNAPRASTNLPPFSRLNPSNETVNSQQRSSFIPSFMSGANENDIADSGDCFILNSSEESPWHILQRPRFMLILLMSVLFLLCYAFFRSDLNTNGNLWSGINAMILFTTILSIVAFPNGPFDKPHPIVWRIAFGLGVMYTVIMLFAAFQDLNTAKEYLYVVSPNLKISRRDMIKMEPVAFRYLQSRGHYIDSCSLITTNQCWNFDWDNLKPHFKPMILIMQILKWFLKTLVIRQWVILWTVNLAMCTGNFILSYILCRHTVCSYDAYVIQFIATNGLGILIGFFLLKLTKWCSYRWVKCNTPPPLDANIQRITVRVKAPASLGINKGSNKRKYINTLMLLLLWNLLEVNEIVLRNLLGIPEGHWISITRCIIILFLAAPTAMQYYIYSYSKDGSHFGTYLWLFLTVSFTEALLAIKWSIQNKHPYSLMYLIGVLFGMWFLEIAILHIWQIWCSAKSVANEENPNASYDLHGTKVFPNIITAEDFIQQKSVM